MVTNWQVRNGFDFPRHIGQITRVREAAGRHSRVLRRWVFCFFQYPSKRELRVGYRKFAVVQLGFPDADVRPDSFGHRVNRNGRIKLHQAG